MHLYHTFEQKTSVLSKSNDIFNRPKWSTACKYDGAYTKAEIA